MITPVGSVQTQRLRLSAWGPEHAAILHQLWRERDPRVPAHRRPSADGRPDEPELAELIRSRPDGWAGGLLAVEEVSTEAVVGYCGLVPGIDPEPATPQIAFELLRRVHGRGYATEAGRAVLDVARGEGLTRLTASVWDWNLPSRRVLGRLGFRVTGEPAVDGPHGRSLLMARSL